jgi:hypothetical protein
LDVIVNKEPGDSAPCNEDALGRLEDEEGADLRGYESGCEVKTEAHRTLTAFGGLVPGSEE